MFNKTKNYLLNYPDTGITRWLNINILVFAAFVGLNSWLHFTTLTVIIVAPILLWIGMGFIAVVGFVKALYDTKMASARRIVTLVLSALCILMMLVGPILVLLMYYEIIPFPPR